MSSTSQKGSWRQLPPPPSEFATAAVHPWCSRAVRVLLDVFMRLGADGAPDFPKGSAVAADACA